MPETSRLRTVLSATRTLAGGLLDALLPQTCAACEAWIPAGRGLLCAACRQELGAAAGQNYCPHCGRSISRLTVHDGRCAGCRAERFWNVAGIARVGTYRNEALRRLLVALKFAGGGNRQADCLGQLLAEALRRQAWRDEIELLVPVPMHWLRRWQRPCDHARELAEALSRRVHIPVCASALRRVRHAVSQTRTRSRAERFRNVRGCFGATRRPRVAGRTVCIIDNLLVSGATIHEVSKVLRVAGARRIYAAVVARSTLPGEPEPRPEPELSQSNP